MAERCGPCDGSPSRQPMRLPPLPQALSWRSWRRHDRGGQGGALAGQIGRRRDRVGRVALTSRCRAVGLSWVCGPTVRHMLVGDPPGWRPTRPKPHPAGGGRSSRHRAGQQERSGAAMEPIRSGRSTALPAHPGRRETTRHAGADRGAALGPQASGTDPSMRNITPLNPGDAPFQHALLVINLISKIGFEVPGLAQGARPASWDGVASGPRAESATADVIRLADTSRPRTDGRLSQTDGSARRLGRSADGPIG